MASDREYYTVPGMKKTEVIARLNNNERMASVCDLATGKRYDCDWQGGCYVDVVGSEDIPRVIFDGQEDNFLDTEHFFEEELEIKLKLIQS
jgi:hypothetical protein